MLRTIRLIARHELLRLLRQRETLLWVFLLPPVFFYFIGSATSIAPMSEAAPRHPLRVETEGLAPDLEAEITARLEAAGFLLNRESVTDETSARLTVRLERTAGTHPRIAFDFAPAGNGPVEQLAALRVARAAYALLLDMATLGPASDELATGAQLAALRAEPRALTVTRTVAGARGPTPTGFEQAIPGILVMFTMLVLLTTGAQRLVEDRQQGRLRRMASTPAGRAGVVGGHLVARFALAAVQLAVALLAGWALFGWDPSRQIGAVALVLAGWAALNAALAVVIGGLARTGAQAAGIGTLVTMTLAALGGCWWPIEVAPTWMQDLSTALPAGWTMTALHKLVSFGEPATSVLPYIAALGLVTVGLTALAARTFRFE